MAMRFRRHQEAAQGQTRGLLLLFALVVLALVLAVNAALALAFHLTFPFAHDYPALFFETNTALVLLAVLGGCWFEQWRLQEGGAHVARLAGGVPALGHGRPTGVLETRLVHVVQEMALASRLRPPAAWVLPRDDAINAFAAGWGEDDAVIAVTRGALERLTREELQGVVAHECSHLAHGDTRLNMRLIGMVWGLEMVFGYGRSLAQRDADGRVPPGALFGWALMAVGSLGWLAGRLLQAAVSRQREFLADASAVQYARHVAGLGGALRKIAGLGARGARLQAPHAPALAHLLLQAPAHAWLASHPPLAERIRRLHGRSLPPLPAPALPLPDAAEAPVFVPAAVPDAPPAAALAPAASDPEAWRHDATQSPETAAAGERAALARVARWVGPLERRAALLALLLDRAPAPRAAARQQAWDAATAGLEGAAALRTTLQPLGRAARLEALTLLARRSAAAPRAERLALRDALQGLAESPAEQLRALAMRRCIDGRPAHWRSPGPRNRLPALAPAVARVSLALGQALGLEPRAAADWQATVLGLLGLPGALPSHGLALRPLAPALARLGRLAPLERPRLARAWVDASAAGLASARRDAMAEALTLACLLLDTPPPRALLDDATGAAEAPAALQLRSL